MLTLSVAIIASWCVAAQPKTPHNDKAIATATSTAANNPEPTAGEYFTDFDRAMKEAATLNRPIFALFTGSDWCPWCIKLHSEILETETFKKFANDNLVLFVADFPRKKKISDELRKQNKALATKYEVSGFPTVLLLNTAGTVIGKTGYRSEGTDKYIVELQDMINQKKTQSTDGVAVGCGYTAKQRIDYRDVSPGGVEALLALEKYVRQSGIEKSLLELVKTRASQINGCAYCLDMHTKDALAEKESEQRLFLLPVWREAPCYTDRERAALAWTEAITLISQNNIGDELYTEVRRYFNEKELVDLTYAIIAINNWNRLNVAMREPVGIYQAKGLK